MNNNGGICFSKDLFHQTPEDGVFTIPAQINGAVVTSIGDGAFDNCSELITLNIHNSVNSIGDRAFARCVGLISVNIPNSVVSVGDGAFDNCRSLLNVIIPDSVTTIGDRAFYNCKTLTSMDIPDSVTSIGDRAFSMCTSLISMRIPNSIISIGNGAFHGNSGMKTVNIPDSVTSIGKYAFYDCGSLTDVIIPDHIKSIGYRAFGGHSQAICFTLRVPLRVPPVYDWALSNKCKLFSTFSYLFEHLSLPDLVRMTRVSKCFYYEVVVRLRHDFVHQRIGSTKTSIMRNTEKLSITCDGKSVSTCVSHGKDELAVYACDSKGIQSASCPPTFLQPDPNTVVLPPESHYGVVLGQ